MKKILLLILLSSVSLFSNAQQDTFSYETISICYSTDYYDTCNVLLTEPSTVYTDLEASLMTFVIGSDTITYELSRSWMIGGINDEMSLFITAYKDDDVYKIIISNSSMILEKEDECVKFKYGLCSG